MNETAAYLDHLARTTADVRVATIETRNDDDSYDVRYIDTQAIDRAAKANPSDEFSLGSRVLIQMPSGSRAVIGSGPVIVSRAPREQRGLSASTPSASTDTYPATVITGIDPDPLILIRGGAAAEQIITGIGLSGAATYSAETGDGPELTNEDAPVVTATKVTMNIKADADSPLGDFTVTVGGKKILKALKIIDGPPALYEEPATLWLLGFGDDGTVLLRVSTATMEVLGQEIIATDDIGDLALVGDTIVARVEESLFFFDRETGDPAGAPVVASGVSPTGAETDSTDGETFYFGGNVDGEFYDFEIGGAIDPHTITAPVGEFGVAAVAADGAVLWILDSLKPDQEAQLVKWNLGTDAEIARIDIATRSTELAVTPEAVFVVRSYEPDIRVVSRRDKATLLETGSATILVGEYDGGSTQIIRHGGQIFGASVRAAGDGGGSVVFRVIPATMAIVKTEMPETATGITAGGSRLYVGDTDGGVTILNAETMAIVERVTFDELTLVQRLLWTVA